ncbi:MAG TPA: TIM barrel protein [Gaiellales bacterium]
MSVRIGNTPVSFGVRRRPDPDWQSLSDDVFDAISSAGYRGSELGPPQFLGTAEETAERIASHALTTIGAYAPVHFAADDELVADDLAGVEQSCRELAACGGGLLVMADQGSETLLAHPARSDRNLALDAAGWRRLAERVQRVVELAEQYELGLTFHPHISTFVESPWEIERLLQLSSVNLTIDSGHLRLAGADPVACLKAWRARVDHVHLKDVRVQVLADAKVQGFRDFDDWWGGVCVPFGDGDVDLTGVLAELAHGGYDGWIVIEQDRAPLASPDDLAAAAAEQRGNLEWLTDQLAVRGGPT